ncbi:hypothetical protein [Methylorubrum extorquens]|uniref:hypothetical protein n=1 Tax=Methylorubrum extorquens TaxID=408 RepID=UPI0020A19FB6|nr:hypothetical protein [Methylorubrum extorquens]MCP1540049.1 hypothetical protein [Methylorubrum extorquens]
MIFGRSLNALKLAARASAIEHFAGQQDAARHSALARTDALKLVEAHKVLREEESAYIVAEADLRGVAPYWLARTIVEASDALALTIELERQRVNLAIDGAKSHVEMKQILEHHGVPWPA